MAGDVAWGVAGGVAGEEESENSGGGTKRGA